MTQMPPKFFDWLHGLKTSLDSACAAAIAAAVRASTKEELLEAARSIRRLYNDSPALAPGMLEVLNPILGSWEDSDRAGADCDYTLAAIGALYTAHWHFKRVRDAIAILSAARRTLELDHPQDVIEIGAGTGASLWAWVLIAEFLGSTGTPTACWTWHSFDDSTPMIRQSERLWRELSKHLPFVDSRVHREDAFKCDWATIPSRTATLLIGSFPFSAQDAQRPEAIASMLEDLIDRLGVRSVLLWVPRRKGAVLDRLRQLLAPPRWSEAQITPNHFRGLEGPVERSCEALLGRCRELGMSRHEKDAMGLNGWRCRWGQSPTSAECLLVRRR